MGLGIVLFLVAAIYAASKFGEASPLIASGKIHLEIEPNGGQTLFITVLSNESPMPIGAMRVAVAPTAPGHLYEFVLTKENLRVMNPDAPLPQSFRLKARLDVDGQGGTDQVGDIVGSAENVQLGQEGLEISLRQRVM